MGTFVKRPFNGAHLNQSATDSEEKEPCLLYNLVFGSRFEKSRNILRYDMCCDSWHCAILVREYHWTVFKCPGTRICHGENSKISRPGWKIRTWAAIVTLQADKRQGHDGVWMAS